VKRRFLSSRVEGAWMTRFEPVRRTRLKEKVERRRDDAENLPVAATPGGS
jgi:hypothetical protein